ncbi:MAG: hypothetical protein R3E32_27165 [Chitinophagales bacterium]
MWFNDLTGFQEESPEQVRANLQVSGNSLTSKVNGKTYVCGRLETPTLAELREKVKSCSVPKGVLTLKEVVGNVQVLHIDSANAGAMFQAASQFNLLEMVSPSVSPEAGVGIYEYDRTQGPACAIAAGAGTIYRNYFASVNGQIGQTTHNQIDCLKDMGNALGNDDNRLWTMQNGYALATKEGLIEISKHIQAMNSKELDELRSTLRIGLQWDTQVTIAGCQHFVSQAYCSALPVAYSAHSSALWADFAQIVLEATYEATLAAAMLNCEKTGNNKVFLTLVGGGVFGNDSSWIFAAIERALQLFADVPLEVAIVSYGQSEVRVRNFINNYSTNLK